MIGEGGGGGRGVMCFIPVDEVPGGGQEQREAQALQHTTLHTQQLSTQDIKTETQSVSFTTRAEAIEALSFFTLFI